MRLFPVLLAALLMAAPSFAEDASAPSVTRVEDPEITRLEILHAEAAKLMEERKPREALKLYTDILLLEPDDDAAYTNMGQAYLLVGDTGRAQEAFWNALHIDPDNEIAMAALDSIADPDGQNAAGALHDSPEEASEVAPE